MNIWYEIINIARHTPSPHNVQPWKFRLTGNTTAILFIDKRRMLPKEDVTGSFVLSAMTMMTETLSLLAANRGHRLETKIVYKNQDILLIPFAELELVADDAVQSVYPDSLFIKRRTSRIHYEDKLIPKDKLKKLATLLEEYGYRFGYTSDATQIETLMKWNIEALFHDLNDPNYHGEISEYFRYTKSQTEKYRDGLDYKCMNSSGIELWLTAKAPWLMRVPALKWLLHLNYRKNLGCIRTIGWITGPFWKPEEGIAAGHALIRFWLETAHLDLYIHPLGNLVTNKEAFSKISDELETKDIWLIFKIGYSEQPPQSQRLPLSEVLID